MPTYSDIQDWVLINRNLRVTHTCWIAHCKAIARGEANPELNAQGGKRVVPCPEGKMRQAIFEAFEAIGAPNGLRYVEAKQ